MATLHKFKLFATQCAVAASSPSGSPSASPVLSLRRRRTLRTFLARGGGGSGRRRPSPTRRTIVAPRPVPAKSPAKDDDLVRRTLKDLFECRDVAVPPPPPSTGGGAAVTEPSERLGNEDGNAGSLLPRSRCEPGSVRPAFGRRLLAKRAWRPLLSSIPE